MKNIFFIHPSTGEKVLATTKEDVKRYTECCWKRVKVVPQYDVRTGKRIN